MTLHTKILTTLKLVRNTFYAHFFGRFSQRESEREGERKKDAKGADITDLN